MKPDSWCRQNRNEASLSVVMIYVRNLKAVGPSPSDSDWLYVINYWELLQNKILYDLVNF